MLNMFGSGSGNKEKQTDVVATSVCFVNVACVTFMLLIAIISDLVFSLERFQ